MPSPAAAPRSALQWQEAFRNNAGGVRQFYAAGFGQWGPERGDWAPLEHADREEWAAALREAGAGDQQLEPLQQLSRPGTEAVLTGQQAGIALGPLFVLYKVLAARAWAQERAGQTGRPCVPIFWIAADDHDVEEAAEAAFIASNGDRHCHLLSSAPPHRPVFDVEVDQEAARGFLEDLAANTFATEFRPALLEALEAALLPPGTTLEDQALGLAVRWLLPLGVVPVTSRMGFLRRRAVPLIRREIEAAGESSSLVRRAGEELAAAGPTPPLHRAGDEVNFFLLHEGMRCKVTRRGGDFTITPPDGTASFSMTQVDLLDRLERDPGAFSPNACLRPLVQDAALPNVATICGPSEFLYHAQLKDLYAHFGVPRPAVFPRPSVVLLETKTLRAAEKLGLEPEDLATTERRPLEERLHTQAVAEEEPPEFADAVQDVENALAMLHQITNSALGDADTARAVEKLRVAADKGLGNVRQRAEQFLSRRNTQRAAAVDKLLEALFPGGQPQERATGWTAPLLANYGEGALEALAKELDPRAGVTGVVMKELETG